MEMIACVADKLNPDSDREKNYYFPETASASIRSRIGLIYLSLVFKLTLFSKNSTF